MATLNAWRQFLASAPEVQREIRAIKVEHVDLDSPELFVQDNVDLVAAGMTFKASSMVITDPSERNDSEQNIQISMGGVTDELQGIIDQITDLGFLSELKITYFKFYSGDLTQPAITPIILFGSSISFENSDSVSFVAEDSDLSNKRSGALYTLSLFPGIASD